MVWPCIISIYFAYFLLLSVS